MSKLAFEQNAINLSQGYPDFPSSPELINLVTNAMKKGYNQYAPMQGILELREEIVKKEDFVKVTLESMRFYEDGGSGSGGGPMWSDGNGTYEKRISTQDYKSGTRVFYRITAKDESGNTAVTPVYTFTL